VKQTKRSYNGSRKQRTKYTIENGVIETKLTTSPFTNYVEDTIQNGVKYTSWHEPILLGTKVEDAIQNGVKEVKTDDSYRNYFKQNHKAEKVIEDGVKETKHIEHDRTTYLAHFNQEHGTHIPLDMVQDVIQNGVKHTEYGDWEDGDERFDDIIQNGIKETKSPGADGDLLSTFEWMKSNNTVNIPGLIDDVIENGVKHTEVGWAQYNSVDDVIERGIKRTEGGMLFDETKVDRIISEGVKETKGGGYLGSIEMKGKMVHQLESPKQNNEVEEVIEHGVKLTNNSLQIDGSCVVEDVIQNGIKETHDDVYHHKGRVDDVIKNGVKEVKPAYRMIYNPMNFEPEIIEDKRLPDITDVICDGIKEVQPLPAQDGNRDWGNYYYRKGEPTKPHTKYVDEVIESGIKETKPIDYSDNTEFIVDGVINRGISI
jgi:predicted peroxiredoxin